jgi:hypothetical protein
MAPASHTPEEDALIQRAMPALPGGVPDAHGNAEVERTLDVFAASRAAAAQGRS